MVDPIARHAPRVRYGRGKEAIELAASAGLELDDWQKLALDLGLRRKGKKWCSTEVGVVVPRQNGKGGILEARELAGLFLFNERLITHSAHLIDTSLEAFYRIKALIEDTPELDQQVAHVSQTNGREGIKLKNGNRLRFRTRTKGAVGGFPATA